MLTRLAIACIVLAALLGSLVSARADVLIVVNKSTQRLSVRVDGELRYEWPVSTARMGYSTPNGTYQPERLERKWFSRKYDWSPMPYSIFFNGGYAIHGSYEISHLGRPVSHGCIRLHPRNAAVLFSLVRGHMNSTQIVVTGQRPSRATKRSERLRSYYYIEGEDGYQPRRSTRSQLTSYRHRHDSQDTFNQAPDGAISDQDLFVQHYWNR